MRVFLVTCCLLCIGYELPAQEWELKKSNNEVKVFAKPVTAGVSMIRVEAKLHGTIEKLMSILKDVSNNKNWVYQTKQSYVINRVNANDFQYYAETSVPILKNRDMVIRMQFTHDPVNQALNIIATGVPQAIPEKKGLVRIKTFNGKWQVKQETANTIFILYHLSLDAGNDIPDGIKEMVAAKGPFETFKNLSKQLK